MNKSTYQSIAFDQDKIKSKLEIGSLPLLAGLEIFETIDSTNYYLLQKAKKQRVSGYVCLAEEQTHGRGRHGRIWYSPKSCNIYCSIGWEFSQQDISSLSLAVGVMVVSALQKFGMGKGVGLKWPNDIVFASRKLGGILLERTGSSVVIGIGLNVCLPKERPEELNAIDLSELTNNHAIDRNHLTGVLINELLTQLPVFATDGFSRFSSDWNNYNILKNQELIIYDAEQTFTGKMVGINSLGELLLADRTGKLLNFRCGEVSVRPDVYHVSENQYECK